MVLATQSVRLETGDRRAPPIARQLDFMAKWLYLLTEIAVQEAPTLLEVSGLYPPTPNIPRDWGLSNCPSRFHGTYDCCGEASYGLAPVSFSANQR